MRKIEPLLKSHDRESFDCGNEALNSFLKHTARQHAERGISKTFVLVEEAAPDPKPILGFFSLNICQIKSEALPPAEAKKLPRDVSGIKLGRLAVCKELQRQGIGKTLLVAAMEKALEIFDTAGGIGLLRPARRGTRSNKASSWFARTCICAGRLWNFGSAGGLETTV